MTDGETLDIIRLRFTEEMDASYAPDMALMNPRADVAYNRIAQRLIFSLRGFLLGEYQEPVRIRHPRDWWQAFRARWFPAWWLRRHPVIETVHELDFRVLYPDFRPTIPRHISRKVVVSDYILTEIPSPASQYPLPSPSPPRAPRTPEELLDMSIRERHRYLGETGRSPGHLHLGRHEMRLFVNLVSNQLSRSSDALQIKSLHGMEIVEEPTHSMLEVRS